MPRVFSLLTLAIFGAGAGTIFANEKPLPAAPKGYTWERAKNAHVSLLKPDGWHFTSNELGHPLQYFVTKQPFARDAKPGTVPYETGVSVSVFRFPPPWKGQEINASGFARQYVELLKSRSGFEFEAFDVPEIAGLHGFGVRYRLTDATGSRRVATVHYGNDATNALYSISILSPLKTWDQDGPLMETVCRNVVVDRRFGGRNAADHERSGVEKAAARRPGRGDCGLQQSHRARPGLRPRLPKPGQRPRRQGRPGRRPRRLRQGDRARPARVLVLLRSRPGAQAKR